MQPPPRKGRTTRAAWLLVAAVAAVVVVFVSVTLPSLAGGARTRGGPAAVRQQRQKLWENYFPGSPAILARYKQVKDMVAARNERMGRPNPTNLIGSHSMADPRVFCKRSFPPVSDFDQDEFQSCLEALGEKVITLADVGSSKVATDIAGAPAGRYAPDGADSLSPGSDGWSRFR